MTKELTHRGEELKKLAWSQEDIFRYIELWEYRQRWGAINLEREDRQFLRKAEAALPEISKVKTSVRKSINEKSYYRWLSFYSNHMRDFENSIKTDDGSGGLWPIIIEEELRILEYYEPVLGLPDTLKAKLLKPLREELIKKSLDLYKANIKVFKFDFKAPLQSLTEDKTNNWKPLRDDDHSDDQEYPVIDSKALMNFVKDVRAKLLPVIRDNFPSLSDTDKPAPPEDWKPKSIS